MAELSLSANNSKALAAGHDRRRIVYEDGKPLALHARGQQRKPRWEGYDAATRSVAARARGESGVGGAAVFGGPGILFGDESGYHGASSGGSSGLFGF